MLYGALAAGLPENEARGPAAGRASLAVAAATASAMGEAAIDEREFEDFHAATWRGLWAYLCRLGGDAALAEDLLQESYLKLLLKPPAEGDLRSRRAYLYQIATNLLRDRQRQSRREGLGLAALFARPRRPAAAPAGRLEVEAALQRLKPRERGLLWLAYAEGCEHREIAAILGLQEKSVRVLLFRARKKLGQELGELGLGVGRKE